MKKMLLMGREQAGKTSMHSIIFANYPAKDTRKIGYTTDRSENKIKFMGNLTLNLWDCGGQEGFMKNYFTTHKETIFKAVAVLIYVFDVSFEDDKSELDDFRKAVQNLQNYSEGAHVFILIHKMDKFKEDEKQERFNRKKKMIEQVANDFPTLQFKEYFPTSIWDETLYQAWSQIVQQLIPKMPFIQDTLRQICEVSGCDEIVLFERSTFLIITCFNKAGRKDILRYERVSNIVKQFKLSCNKMGASIDSVFVKSDKMTTLIREFTDNTSIMVIYSNPEIQESLINLNIAYAGKHFEKHIKQ